MPWDRVNLKGFTTQILFIGSKQSAKTMVLAQYIKITVICPLFLINECSHFTQNTKKKKRQNYET